MMRLTILFDAPYWIGLLEKEEQGLLYVARHIFGAEPSDQEVYEFVQRDLLRLQAQMTVGLPIDVTRAEHPVNPKRVQREIKRALLADGISSKAHEAMRLQIEQNKQMRQQETKADRDAARAYKRQINRDKARAKHRGH